MANQKLDFALVCLTAILGAGAEGKARNSRVSQDDRRLFKKLHKIIDLAWKINENEWDKALRAAQVLLFDELVKINRLVCKGKLDEDDQFNLIQEAWGNCSQRWGPFPGPANFNLLMQTRSEIEELGGPSEAASFAVAEYCDYSSGSYLRRLKKRNRKAFNLMSQDHSFERGLRILVEAASKSGHFDEDKAAHLLEML